MAGETERNRAIVLSFFTTANNGGDVLDLLSDDAEWWVPEHWRFGGTHSKTDVRAIFEQVFTVFRDPPRFTINAVTAEDDRVAVDCVSEGCFTDGEPFRNSYHFLFRVRDGKIALVKEFLNTVYMERMLETRLPNAK